MSGLSESVVNELNQLEVLGGPVVVAVSGGSDSLALLHAVAEAGARYAPIIAAHVNHQLRGDESERDEAFVAAVAQRLGLTLACCRMDTRAHAQHCRQNLEQAARRLRYEWLAQTAKQYGASAVLTGHTADDQAETVLHHLVRGTGLAGLRGIAPRRRLTEGVWLVRPLLGWTRADLRQQLCQRGLSWCEDSSNHDPRYTRNRIRHELLPLLRGYNPQVVRALTRLAEQAREAMRQVSADAETLLARAELPRDGAAVRLSRCELLAAGRARTRALLRHLWEREGWPRDRVGYAEYERVLAVVNGEVLAVDLPGGVSARRRGKVIVLQR